MGGSPARRARGSAADRGQPRGSGRGPGRHSFKAEGDRHGAEAWELGPLS